MLARSADPARRPAIALAGTFPPGISPELYTAVAEAKPQGVLLLLDACES